MEKITSNWKYYSGHHQTNNDERKSKKRIIQKNKKNSKPCSVAEISLKEYEPVQSSL